MIILKIFGFIILIFMVMGLVGALMLSFGVYRLKKRMREGMKQQQSRREQPHREPLQAEADDMVECPSCSTYVKKTPAFIKTGVCEKCRN